MRYTFLVGIALVGTVPGLAVAETGRGPQSRDDVCVAARSLQITRQEGDVRVSTAQGLVRVATGTSLVAGQRLVARDGSAELAVDGERVVVPQNTMLTVVRREDRTCYREASLGQGEPQPAAEVDPTAVTKAVFAAYTAGLLADLAFSENTPSRHVSP